VPYAVGMNKLVFLAGILMFAACGKDGDAKAGAAAAKGGKTLAELAASADAPDDLKQAVPADVVVGRPLKVSVEPAPPAAPQAIVVETCSPGEPASVFVPLGDWVKRERPGAFSVTGTIDIKAHWKGGEILGDSERGHGCNEDEFYSRFLIRRSKD